ncbi:hypothetical protein D5086_006488 [Populus alba]|uniref:Uncharacterized protein n=1 Tax=Populus alba TaxID=43335 RepID=A0ACC4CL58_POPAL
MFTGSKCHHDSYCKDCISKHVSTMVEENIIRVKCPDPEFDEAIEHETCRSIVPLVVLDRWEIALGKSVIPDSKDFIVLTKTAQFCKLKMDAAD